MKLVKQGQGEAYEAKGHFGYWSMRKLVAGQDSQRLTISLTHFLPGGGTDMSGSPNEKTYFVLSGSMVVKGKTEEYLIGPGDVLYIAAGEEREIKVIGSEPCTILLSVVKLD